MQVRVRVRQDAGQIHFSLVDSPATRVRHNLVPRWHYDMVLDQQRNEMYDRAISGAVKRLQQAGRKVVPLRMLDSEWPALLSSMAVRNPKAPGTAV